MRLKKLLLTIIGFVLSLVLLEILGRFVLEKPQVILIENLNQDSPDKYGLEKLGLAASDIFYQSLTGLRLKKNVKGIIKQHDLSKKEVEFTTNSLGFRSKELKEKGQNDFRVLVLGDSITFAEYLPEEETYPYYLNQYLKARGGRNIEVVNAGVGMIGAENELAILMETGLQTKPDVVIVELYLNDAKESVSLKLIKIPKLIQKSYLLNYLVHKANIFRAKNFQNIVTDKGVEQETLRFMSLHPVAASTDSWAKDQASFNRLIAEYYHDWGYAWDDTYWKKIEEVFTLMKQIRDGHNFKLVVVFFPVKYQVQSEILRDEPQRKFEELMTKLDLPHLNLLPSLREKYTRDKIDLYYDHAHPKAEGMKFMGEEIGKLMFP